MLVRVVVLGVLSLLLLANSYSFAQSKAQKEAADSTAWMKNDTSSVKKKKHSPRKATLLSTFVPGLGQVYNRQYWKVPIVAGAGIIFAALISSNNHDWKQANHDYDRRLENEANNYVNATADPNLYDAYDAKNPVNFVGSGVRTYSTNQLRLTRDAYRRDRDFYIILSAVVYALNIVDAAVFAHLREFEVSDKLSMKIDPNFYFTPNMNPVAGLSCSLYLTK